MLTKKIAMIGTIWYVILSGMIRVREVARKSSLWVIATAFEEEGNIAQYRIIGGEWLVENSIVFAVYSRAFINSYDCLE